MSVKYRKCDSMKNKLLIFAGKQLKTPLHLISCISQRYAQGQLIRLNYEPTPKLCSCTIRYSCWVLHSFEFTEYINKALHFKLTVWPQIDLPLPWNTTVPLELENNLNYLSSNLNYLSYLLWDCSTPLIVCIPPINHPRHLAIHSMNI